MANFDFSMTHRERLKLAFREYSEDTQRILKEQSERKRAIRLHYTVEA